LVSNAFVSPKQDQFSIPTSHIRSSIKLVFLSQIPSSTWREYPERDVVIRVPVQEFAMPYWVIFPILFDFFFFSNDDPD